MYVNYTAILILKDNVKNIPSYLRFGQALILLDQNINAK